jgi:hypothetical protein
MPTSCSSDFSDLSYSGDTKESDIKLITFNVVFACIRMNAQCNTWTKDKKAGKHPLSNLLALDAPKLQSCISTDVMKRLFKSNNHSQTDTVLEWWSAFRKH